MKTNEIKVGQKVGLIVYNTVKTEDRIKEVEVKHITSKCFYVGAPLICIKKATLKDDTPFGWSCEMIPDLDEYYENIRRTKLAKQIVNIARRGGFDSDLVSSSKITEADLNNLLVFLKSI